MVHSVSNRVQCGNSSSHCESVRRSKKVSIVKSELEYLSYKSNNKQLTKSQYPIANSPSTPDLCGIKQMVAKLHRIAPFDTKLLRHFYRNACTTGLFQADSSQEEGMIYLLHLVLARGRGSLVKNSAAVDCSRVTRTTLRDWP
jgi:hypothetical protein